MDERDTARTPGAQMLDAAARQMALAVPPPPPGLADRVMARIAEAETAHNLNGGLVMTNDRTPRISKISWLPNPVAGPAVRALAVAASALLVVGSLAVLAGPRGGDLGDPAAHGLLLTAARATEAARYARVEVSGSAETTVHIRRLPELPDLPEIELPPVPEIEDPEFEVPAFEVPEGLPEGFELPEDFAVPEAPDPSELRAQAQASRDEAQEEAQRRVQEFEEQVRTMLENLPREFHARWEFHASGVVEIPGRLELEGEARLVESTPEVPDGSGRFHVVVSNDVTYTEHPDGSYSRTGEGPGALEALVARPGAAVDLMAEAENAQDLGEEEQDGQRVRHLRFEADGNTVDAWIGSDDHIVRKMTVTSSGREERDGIEVEWRAEATIRVTPMDGPVTILVPPPDAVVTLPDAYAEVVGQISPFGETVPLPYA